MFDVCAVGHVTQDIIRIENTEQDMPGGTAYYFAVALKSLGMNVSVITKINKQDMTLLSQLKSERIAVFEKESDRTTIFVNAYSRETGEREQWVRDVALPFTVKDVTGTQAEIFHIGPLTKGDVPLDVIQYLADRGKISLDVQGFLREVDGRCGEEAKVQLTDWDEKKAALPLVSILKANEEEARILSQEEGLEEMAAQLSRYGPKEVIITRGSKPSLIYAGGRVFSIPAFPPRKLVDPTGCGDTYMAGYLFLRGKTSNIYEAGKFAAMVASLKLETSGPFRGGQDAVRVFADTIGYRSPSTD